MSGFSPGMPGLHQESVKAAFEFMDPNVKVAMNPSTNGESVK